MKPIIGYARVSTEEQANTHALEQQKSRLIHAGVQEIYSDIESGREQDRDQFKKILELVDFGGSLPAIMQPKPYPCKST